MSTDEYMELPMPKKSEGARECWNCDCSCTLGVCFSLIIRLESGVERQRDFCSVSCLKEYVTDNMGGFP